MLYARFLLIIKKGSRGTNRTDLLTVNTPTFSTNLFTKNEGLVKQIISSFDFIFVPFRPSVIEIFLPLNTKNKKQTK